MLTFTLILASFITPLNSSPDQEGSALDAVIQETQFSAPDLTLMQGYERYLADPSMLSQQRDA